MKLLCIDSNSIFNRAFYGIKLLSTKDGMYTNAIYGFMNILLKLCDEVQPDYVVCAFDRREPTFRHQRYAQYKGTRKGMPEELAMQVEPLKELLHDLGFCTVEQPGYEADDILGTFAKRCKATGVACFLASGDRDNQQLVDEGVTLLLASTQMGRPQTVYCDPAYIREKYGLAPRQLIQVKGLMGDSSDNIPGVPGIGEKTALKLIAENGTIEAIYRDLPQLKIAPGVKAKLEKGKELAFLSLELAEICCDAPIDAEPTHYARGPIDHPAAYRLLARLEMFSLIERLGVQAQGELPPEESASPGKTLRLLINDREAVENLVETVERFDLLVEFIGEEPVKCALVEENACCLLGEDYPALPVLLQRILTDPRPKRVESSKPCAKFVFGAGLQPQNLAFDLSLAGYLLSPNSTEYTAPRLCAEYGALPASLEGELPEAFRSLGERAAAFAAVADLLEEKIDENQQRALLVQVEQPLAKVLADMELLGFSIDTEACRSFGVQLDDEIAVVQGRIYQLAGEEFNILSPKQLGVILFEKLGLPARKKTKSGYSTDVDVLNSLRDKHPVVEWILEYRSLTKLKSTYVDGLLKVVAADGRIHSRFNQTETRTGRISSTEPNLQNIPVRTELGSNLRRFFKAKEGCLLVDADYSQIELRVLAHISQDKNMIAAFTSGEDIHTQTASQVFGLPPLFVTPELRRRAKAVNFGIVYGIGAFSLAQDIGVSIAEADRYIKDYLETYSGVKQYMEQTVAFAQENGYVSTLYHRRRYLPELASSNKNIQAFGRRVAMNTPIQGTAADIIKIAMVRVWERLRREGMSSRLILQVHDELIVEAPEAEAARAAAILREEMEQAAQLAVPLLVDVHTGKSWYDAK